MKVCTYIKYGYKKKSHVLMIRKFSNAYKPNRFDKSTTCIMNYSS